MDQILVDVRSILARVLRIDASEVQAQSDVQALPNVDSAAILEAIVAIEDHFGIEFPDAAVPKIQRVSDIADVVQRLVAERPAAAAS
jgi:acyl carrier protein